KASSPARQSALSSPVSMWSLPLCCPGRYHVRLLSVAVVLVLQSSKAVDETATQHAACWRWASPDPGFGPGVEVVGRHSCRQIDLLGVGKGLASERLATEEPPPTFLQVQPAGPRRERDGVHAGMLCQPLLDRPTRMAGEIVADQVQLARGIGGVQQREELEVGDGVARGRCEGHFVAVTHPQGPIDPDFLLATTVIQGRLNPVAGGRPARGW